MQSLLHPANLLQLLLSPRQVVEAEVAMVPLQSASYLQLYFFFDSQIQRSTNIKILNSKLECFFVSGGWLRTVVVEADGRWGLTWFPGT